MELPEPDFPSSAGRPFRSPDAQLLERRHQLAAAAQALDAAAAHELAARAWRLWMAARDISGGRAFLRDVLDNGEPPQTRWRSLALYGDGLFAWWEGERDQSRSRNEEALAIAQRLDDAEPLALAQLGLSRIAVDDGDYQRGRELAQAARTAAADLGEPMGQAPLHLEAQATRLSGDYDRATALFEQSLALNRRIDDPSMVAVELQNLGLVELHRGNVDATERYFAELPPPADEYTRALASLNAAAIAFGRGDDERARTLLEQMEAVELASDDRAELDWLREQLECPTT